MSTIGTERTKLSVVVMTGSVVLRPRSEYTPHAMPAN
jgi:hypothetical protein